MHRGKAIQQMRDCDYCSKPLPEIRHPDMKYCDPICRGRDRYAREHAGQGMKCLDCMRTFKRVGSHVVQAHGYESTAEYLREHGLMAKETRTDEYAQSMREKVTNKAKDNLAHGTPTRFQKGGEHGEKLKEFWNNRKAKGGFKEVGTTLNNRES